MKTMWFQLFFKEKNSQSFFLRFNFSISKLQNSIIHLQPPPSKVSNCLGITISWFKANILITAQFELFELWSLILVFLYIMIGSTKQFNRRGEKHYRKFATQHPDRYTLVPYRFLDSLPTCCFSDVISCLVAAAFPVSSLSLLFWFQNVTWVESGSAPHKFMHISFGDISKFEFGFVTLDPL